MPTRKPSPPAKKSGNEWKRKPKASGFDKRSYRQHRDVKFSTAASRGTRRPDVAATPTIVERKILRVILFYKPFGVLSQFTDETGKRTLAEFKFPKGVYPVGRLDFDSEGLLLLTDDNELKHRLLNPRNAHERTYLVQVERVPDEAALTALRRGVDIGGEKTKPAKVHIVYDEPNIPDREKPIRFRKNVPTAWLSLTITEGKNRQVRRMTAAVGHPTLRLVRTAIGPYALGQLQSGTWKFA